MKAEAAQQRSLLELAKLDAELSRIAHRSTHLPRGPLSSRFGFSTRRSVTDSVRCESRWRTWTPRFHA